MTFVEILDQYRIPYVTGGSHHHVMYGWLGFDCFACGPNSGQFHMGYSLEKKYTTCWRCGYHSLFSVLEQLTREPPPTVAELVRGLGRVFSIPSPPRGCLRLPNGIGPLGLAHKKYLQARNLDYLEAERVWGAQGIGIAEKLAWRIFIPITHQNKIVSWTTRALSNNNSPRYSNAKPNQESLSAKTILYGADHCQQTILICEGPLDVWRIGPGTVATLGVGYSKAQLVKASKYPRRYVCFDQEKEAQKRASKLCDELSLYPGETWNVTIDAKDPGSAGEKEVKHLRKLIK